MTSLAFSPLNLIDNALQIVVELLTAPASTRSRDFYQIEMEQDEQNT